MFRFLTDRYPLIMQPLDEDHVFDHFYLDMNGIIHQCTHPNDDEIAIEDEEEMFARIFEYTERLFRIVGPRRIMILAVDGVAPRAKMNQQRSRRFRSAKDAERALGEMIARGDEIPSGKHFDSNCITPGTQFMHNLSKRFRSWINFKMSKDPAWQQGCTVIFSGAEVPGEGEHKIMDFIRQWKKSDDFSPQIRHCLYGLDADLMMLGLVAHAPHFTLLREKMKFSRGGIRKTPQMRGTWKDAEEFQLLEISLLRDMLFLEFQRAQDETDSDQGAALARASSRRLRAGKGPSTGPGQIIGNSTTIKSTDGTGRRFRVDASRIVDDFVFMCILVGNDFVPHLPHLDIAEGAINLMFRIYKKMLPAWGGYLTDKHRLHPDRLEAFLARVSESERHYFFNRGNADDIQDYKTPKFRRKYYLEKFGFAVDNVDAEENLRRLRQVYMEGLHWVLQYYHNGVSSWNWYYPDFYALLASDMVSLRRIKVRFQKGRPFRPLTQLMAVLPPESAEFLPAPMQYLMTAVDSPVVDFYPHEFEIDQNGKKNPWEAVVVIPFIKEDRLLQEIQKINAEELTNEEKERNQFGRNKWFHARHYPRIDYKIPPVRPLKFLGIRRSRSSSPEYSSRSSASSRSSSPNARRTNMGPKTGTDSRSSSPSSAKIRLRTTGQSANQSVKPRGSVSAHDSSQGKGGQAGRETRRETGIAPEGRSIRRVRGRTGDNGNVERSEGTSSSG